MKSVLVAVIATLGMAVATRHVQGQSLVAAPTIRMTYPAGWNLIAGSGVALSSVSGSIYTWQAGDSEYESLPASSVLEPLKGYWVYFDRPTDEELPTGGTITGGVPLPAGLNVMVGRPAFGGAQTTGADILYVFDPATQSYEQVTALLPGQGAWARSRTGDTFTVTPPGAPGIADAPVVPPTR